MGQPFPSLADLPNTAIEPRSPALQADSLPAEPQGKPNLKEITPEYSLEGLTLKLKFQYFGHLMQRSSSLEKTLMLGKTEGGRRGGQRVRRLDGVTDSMSVSLDMSWT